MVTLSPSSRCTSPPHYPSPDVLYQTHQAAGQEQDGGHQDGTEDKHVVFAPVARLEDFLDVGKDDRADDRAINTPEAAENSHQYRAERHHRAEGNARVHISPFGRHDSADGT